MIRSAFRQLTRRPGLGLLALVILALGLAPLVAGWTAYLRREAWRHEGRGETRLAWVECRAPGARAQEEPGQVPSALLQDLQVQAPFEAVVAARQGMVRTLDVRADADFLATHRSLLQVDPALFPLLGLRMRLGRALAPGDATGAAVPVAVLTERSWRRHFAADPQVVGRGVELQGMSFQVVGVLGSVLPHPAWDEADFLLPAAGGGRAGKPGDSGDALGVLVRLKPGWNRDQAVAAIRPLAPDPRRSSLTLRPLGGRMRLAELGLILGFGLPAFLVATAAVSSLLLALGTARQGELALRGVLGAPRGRLLAESMLPALLLCLPAVALAWAPSQGLLRLLAPGLVNPQPDLKLFMGLAVLAVLGALAAGLWPAWRASGVEPAVLLGRGVLVTPGDARRGWARLLVSGQVAVALALLGTSALAWAHQHKALDVEPFPAWRQVGLVHLGLGPQGREALKTRMSALPGVQALSVGMADPLPATPGGTLIRTEGGREAHVSANVGDANLLDLLGLRLRMGRLPQADGEVVVSEAMARRLWGGVDVLGRTCQRPLGPDRPAESLGVVGVCEDPRDVSLNGRPVPWMMGLDRTTAGRVQVMVRWASADAAALERFRQGLGVPVEGLPPTVHTVRGIRQQQVKAFAELSGVLLVLGLLVLVLALSGLSGLVHVMVARRTRKLGVRSSLGATRRTLVGQVLRETLAMAAWGLPAGMLGLLLLGTLVSRLFVGFQPIHWASFLLLPPGLAGAVALAALAPALRAASVDPARALRAE